MKITRNQYVSDNFLDNITSVRVAKIKIRRIDSDYIFHVNLRSSIAPKSIVDVILYDNHLIGSIIPTPPNHQYWLNPVFHELILSHGINLYDYWY